MSTYVCYYTYHSELDEKNISKEPFMKISFVVYKKNVFGTFL